MMNLVREGLYIGNIYDAVNILRHGSDKITHILSILKHTDIQFLTESDSFSAAGLPPIVIPFGEAQVAHSGHAVYRIERAGKDLKFVRMSVPITDTTESNILGYFDACIDFIDKGRRNGGVLVHCRAGVSRSATVVAAYLVRSEGLSAAHAIASVRESRAIVNPNVGFVKQVEEFEMMISMVKRLCESVRSS